MNSAQISMAFNATNSVKSWTARASARPQEGFDYVHFTQAKGLITIVYNAMDGRFHVQFNKFHASWGDYVKAIARSMYHVLTTLKAAGLPFEAPLSPEGIVIEASSGDDGTTYVRWPGQVPPVTPELRAF